MVAGGARVVGHGDAVPLVALGELDLLEQLEDVVEEAHVLHLADGEHGGLLDGVVVVAHELPQDLFAGAVLEVLDRLEAGDQHDRVVLVLGHRRDDLRSGVAGQGALHAQVLDGRGADVLIAVLRELRELVDDLLVLRVGERLDGVDLGADLLLALEPLGLELGLVGGECLGELFGRGERRRRLLGGLLLDRIPGEGGGGGKRENGEER